MSSRSPTSHSGAPAEEETERRARRPRHSSGEGDVMPPPVTVDVDVSGARRRGGDSAADGSARNAASTADAAGDAGGDAGGDPAPPVAGDWLFKQNEMVLGPVTAHVLIEKIKKGELPTGTLVARDGEPFKEMRLVGFFRDALEEYTERVRQEEEDRAYAAALRKANVLRALALACIVLIPSAGGAVAGRVVMVERPWDDTPSWIQRSPGAVNLEPRPPPPPKIALVTPPSERPPDAAPDDAAAPNGGDSNSDGAGRPTKADRRKTDTHRDEATQQATKAGAGAPTPAAAASSDGDKGYVKELTNEQAIAPLKDVKGALGACFKAELAANPDMPAQLVLAYTVTEEGRAANAEITNRELRGGPIQECVRNALSSARWPRFTGERKNVSVPFNIKKPPKLQTSPGAGSP